MPANFNIQDLVRPKTYGDREDINTALGQQPETGFLLPNPTPTPTPSPPKTKTYATQVR